MSEARKQNLPEPRPEKAPARHYSTEELEAVIRRAVELQSGPASREEGVSANEVVRIAQELGLEPGAVRHAMAEVRSRPPAEQTTLGRSMGPGLARAARVVRRTAAATERLLSEYLRERELMVVQRRFPERTRYVRDGSIGAGLARMARGFGRSEQPLDLPRVDLAVSAIDAESCLVELSVDMGGARAGYAAGALGLGGSAAAGLATAIWATPVADPLMLLGLPVLGAAWYGMRAIYGATHRSTQEKLESFLDRLEHGDLRPS